MTTRARPGDGADRLPSVSIAIPALNEASHIEGLIRGFLNTRYPNLIEIIVADGGSTDGTQEIVKSISDGDARVELIHNPESIQATGLNLILQKAAGDVFLRADAHCAYADDYIERCVETLLRTKSVNVGGAQRFVAETAFQAGVSLASRSILGSGRARYRDPDFDGNVEAVYLGCFWRRALLEVGGYSLKATNEDAELNLKLLERFGEESSRGVLYTSSAIKVWYHPRKSWWELCRQYFRYGRGRCQTFLAHPASSPLRGVLPFLFLSFMGLLILADLFLLSGQLHTRELVGVGLALPFLEGLRVALQGRSSFEADIWRGAGTPPTLFSRALICGVVLVSQPLAHFLGFAYQALQAVRPREAHA